MKKLLYAVLGLAVIGAGLWLFGPRVPVDTRVTFDASALPTDLDAYLAAEEANVPALRDGLAKEIVWAYPASKAKTPLALVYIHGFSASKGEVRPLPDIVARELGANLFYARLTGHGQDGAAMATASVNAWVNDYAEAIAIGRAIGERVIVIGTSTGGGLITWGLGEPKLAEGIAGTVLISPNYGVQAGGSEILTMPFGKQIANLVVGMERSFVPENELHGSLWTPRYPTEALLPMGALTAMAAAEPVEEITVPAFFIYSKGDRVIRPELVEAIAARWGAKATTLVVDRTDDPYSHVIAGNALSPSTTEPLADAIVAWVKAL